MCSPPARPDSPRRPTLPDKLVATGNKTVDAYLKTARAMLVPQRTLEDAERRLTRAQENDRRRYGFGGAAEARQRAERRYDEANRDMNSAWRAEKAAAVASCAADLNVHAKAAAAVEVMWIDFYNHPRYQQEV
ncbi:hypothetical protein [Nonomuraea sp. NPDC049480]|uniref:hypothetical protein n=1 Tax=Nonomuraea sp. NPDC049480 TaxID=3364353 RepID=UPI00379ADA35